MNPLIVSLSPLTVPRDLSNYFWNVRFEVLTAMTVKSAADWHIEPQFVPHGRHIVYATEPSRLMLCKI
jgi:hypothetical protein